MKVALRDAVPGDIDAMLPRMREADVAEMAALGRTIEDALRDSLTVSDWAVTGLVDGEPVCMFGVAPVSVMNGIGAPWMLATDDLEAVQVKFLRTCRPVVRMMRETYPRLLNIADPRNTTVIRWLRWLGFGFSDEPIEINGHAFVPFRSGDW